MASETDLIEQVRRLVEAENERNRATADEILAQDFAAITRARGVEQNRDALLAEVENPKNPNLRRELGESDLWVRVSGDQGVVRSLVKTTDRTSPDEAPTTFRNVHVFERQGESWKCLAWQVTKLE
jgi:Domain of unknown function (DUF4440)